MVNSKGDGKDLEAKLDEKLDGNKRDMEQLVKDGYEGIKNLIGEKLTQFVSKLDVCTKVLRDVVADARADEYRRQVEDKLARNASLVLSRPNGGQAKASTAEEVWRFIHSQFPNGEAPGFALDPMGKMGSYRLYPETFSPIRSRQICANILHLLKDGRLKDKFGLNAFYDNPMFLRKIRSDALRFTATMLQAEGLKLGTKPFVKKAVLMLDGVPMFSEYLVPEDESFWPSAYPIISSLLRSPPSDVDSAPVAEAEMRDLYVAAKGLIFPRHPSDDAMMA
jgi:hypothetical protein